MGQGSWALLDLRWALSAGRPAGDVAAHMGGRRVNRHNASGGEVQREPRRGKALEVRWLELRQGEGMASCGEARDGWIRGRVARSERWCEERSTGCAGRRRREFEPWQPGLLPARETDRA